MRRPCKAQHAPFCPSRRRNGQNLWCRGLHSQPSETKGESWLNMTLLQPEKKHRKDSAHQQPWRLVRPETLWVVLRNTVLTTVSVLCYANSLHGELVHDDMWAVVNNPDVRAGSSVLNIFSNDFWGKKMWDNASHKSYRPLSILTFKQGFFCCCCIFLTTRLVVIVRHSYLPPHLCKHTQRLTPHNS